LLIYLSDQIVLRVHITRHALRHLERHFVCVLRIELRLVDVDAVLNCDSRSLLSNPDLKLICFLPLLLTILPTCSASASVAA